MDLYRRLKLNVDLCVELNISIYSIYRVKRENAERAMSEEKL